MKKLPISGKQALYLLLAIIVVVLLFFIKKAVLLTLLLAIGFISNYIVFKVRVANFTANFFLSFIVLHFYGPIEFFIFLFVAEVLPRPFTGVALPGTAYPGYIIWIVLAFFSLSFSNLMAIGVTLVLVRYLITIFLHMLGGSGFYTAIIRNLFQPVINVACFLYILPLILPLF